MIVVVGLASEEEVRCGWDPERVVEVNLRVEVGEGQDCVEVGHEDVDADEVSREVVPRVVHEGSVTGKDVAVDR